MSHRWIAFALVAACAAGASLMPLVAAAQGLGAKPVRLIVPYPPGGLDMAARAMVPRMQTLLGQPIVVDTRGGANGIIGAEIVARSAPDGYTLLFPASSTIVGAARMTRDVPWDPVRDFTPISYLFDIPRVVTVHASLPVNSLAELIEYAKRNPGKLSFGSTGIGSSFHLDGEILNMAAGTSIVHVPYKGTGPMLIDMASGRIEVGIGAISSIEPHIKSGKLKLLAFMEPRRNARYPSVPTVAEILPGTQKSPSWIGLMGPPGLPPPILQRLHAAAVASLHSPEAEDYFAKASIEVHGSSPQELADMIKEGLVRMSELLDRLGIKPQ